MKGSGRGRTLAVVAALVALVIAALSPVLSNGFVNYDDDVYVTSNPEVRAGLGLSGVRWALTTGHAGNWHPITWLSHMLDVEAFGLRPAGHHLTSLVLHAANVLLVFAFLRRATGSLWRSAFAAALFGVHPLRVESVAWVAERKDVLSGLFALLALLAHGRFARTREPLARAAVLATLAAGLLSKPMLVTLPLLLLWTDRWPLERHDGWRAQILEKLPLAAIAAAASAVTLAVQRAGLATGSLEQYPPALRLANALASIADYLARAARPLGLAVFYPYPTGGVPAEKLAAAAAAILATTWAAIRLRRRAPYLLFGWLWFVTALLPVIGLVQVGEQASADRYTYLPLLGVFVAAAWGLADLARLAGRSAGVESAARRSAAALAALIVAALVLLSRAQASVWRDSTTLFEHALAVTGPNHVAHLNLGLALVAAGRNAEAISHLEEAVRIRPDHPTAHAALGEALGRAGRLDEAIRELRTSIGIDSRRPEAKAALALVLARAGRAGESLPLFEEASRALPDDAELRYNQGTALAAAGRFEDAAAAFREAVRLDPRHAKARYNLGATLARLGDAAGADAEIRAARDLGYVPPR